MHAFTKAIASAAVLAGFFQVARADSLTLSQNSSYSVGIGGAFVAQVVNGPIDNADYSGAAKIGSNGFLTFCIEYNEYFNSGGTYNYVVNTGATNGGVS